ncbi:uncharacterized protein MONOS_17376 [Monocercomonoides exilis]|uniref:uncharacterized protein n=1 Tax=Monocercomonoides exilis TaxID=2049356 RepID=UPI003559A591|nr:hypothetical protein MONOS_17376 [Monocercomonoides exilis]
MRHLDLICSNGIEFWRATVHFAKEGTEDDFPKQDMIALAELWREGCGWLVPDGAAAFFAKWEDGGILNEVPLLVEKRVFAMLQTKPLFPVKINFVLDVLLYCYPVILRENSSLFDSLVHMGNSEATIDYVAHSVGYGQRQADEHILEQRERDKEKEENNEEKNPSG